MSSDVSGQPESLYQLRLVSILARVFYRFMEGHQAFYETQAGKLRLKSGAQRSRDHAVLEFAYELLSQDLLLAEDADPIAAWMLDLGLSHNLLRWNSGSLVIARMPSLGECQDMVRAKWREARASGHPLIRDHRNRP